MISLVVSSELWRSVAGLVRRVFDTCDGVVSSWVGSMYIGLGVLIGEGMSFWSSFLSGVLVLSS